MRLYVYVLEARGLPARRDGGELFYAKVTMGKKQRFRTRAVEPGPSGAATAAWNEEFVFAPGADDEEVEVAVARRRRDGRRRREVVGAVRLPVPAASAALATAATGERRSVPPTWFTLQPPLDHRRRKGGDDADAGAAAADCGKILLTISLYGESNDHAVIHQSTCLSSRSDTDSEIDSMEHSDSNSITEDDDLAQISPAVANGANDTQPMAPDASFEEAMEFMKSKSTPDMPEDLDSGIIFEHSYLVRSRDLNRLLFGPDSQFSKDLRELQGTTDYEEQPWTWRSKDPPSLTRTCQYTKGSSKLMKAVKTTEEQTYLKADGKNFVVMTRVRTPEVPFGNCFAVVLLYKIIHCTGLSSDEESAHLTVSYNVEFLQSTMMRSMIEGSIRDGLKENFESFGEILSRHVKLADSIAMDKEQLLAPLQAEHQSVIRLAYKYFCNFTAISAVLIALYVFAHIFLSKPGPLMGLEFNGLDLPDTFGELITSGVLVLLLERLLNMVSHFVQARVQRGSDHGVKANGDGWLLTVALLEATSLPPVSSGSVDPYVVFSCNGITKTSSVQLQTQEPQWNEIMEFDAMEEPPAVLDVEGRLFVSARIVGFYANLFGHKTKFFFLWEDVEEVEVLQPSFTTVGTPSLQFTLKSGRGLDAKRGAKSQDKEGRLKFQFHSFASFSKSSRTILGLWKTKSSAVEQRAKMEEDQEEYDSSIDIDDVQNVLNIGDVPLSKEYTVEHPIDVRSLYFFATSVVISVADLLMGVFDGGPLETRTMSRVGCLDYSATPWEHARPGVDERHVSYKFNRYMSIFGGEVVSTQFKFPAEDGDGWSIHDVVTLHNVPFGDYFRVHLRYNVQSVASEPASCRCEILVGIEWLKSSMFQKKIVKNICEKLAHRAKEVLEAAGKEIASAVS
ncbi:hypothetical protein PR202_gb15296 [Eleusine coracana subsp. coracana]|uniref:C2 and GRAM domain-containing protein n=1 Tax=Eleusine coracana subsp. coracana TaxID=191504 RepID=A0AAV5EZ14_ELECO|nr:hypothetical protein PR202_gb15296 [Eleusine coracana subsp. coracana]